jgi:hypothetical protein
MPSPYQKEILAQVLDGKRSWSNVEVDGDPDVLRLRLSSRFAN